MCYFSEREYVTTLRSLFAAAIPSACLSSVYNVRAPATQGKGDITATIQLANENCNACNVISAVQLCISKLTKMSTPKK